MAILSRSGRSRREERREALLARLGGAVEETLRGGGTYADLTVERILRAAGVARTTFYAYFADKRELLLALAERFTAELVEAAQGWRATGATLGEDELRRVLELFLNANRDRPLLAALTEAAAYDEEVRAAWRAHQDVLIGVIEARLHEEQREGRAPAFPVRATACALHWMVQQTCYQEMVVAHNLSDDDYLDALVGLWMRGVRVGGELDPRSS
jgi:AcrR family transcriptional regulator